MTTATSPSMITVSSTAKKAIPVDLVGKNYLLTPPKGSLGLRIAKQAQELEVQTKAATAAKERITLLQDAGRDEEASKIEVPKQDPTLMLDLVYDWVRAAFGPKQYAAIKERLDSADDDLDFPHLMELMQAVTEYTAANPTS